MAKVRTKHFENTDLEIVPFERSPELDENIGQALVRVMGWDYINELWRRIRIDDTGSIGVVVSPSASAALECTAITVAGAADLLVAANGNRRSIRLFNQGPDPIVIDDNAGVALASGFPLAAGGEWFSETYRGDVFALINGTTAVVRTIEER